MGQKSRSKLVLKKYLRKTFLDKIDFSIKKISIHFMEKMLFMQIHADKNNLFVLNIFEICVHFYLEDAITLSLLLKNGHLIANFSLKKVF